MIGCEQILGSPQDVNFYRLVQDAFSANIRGYNYRSYVICPPLEHESFPVEVIRSLGPGANGACLPTPTQTYFFTFKALAGLSLS